MNKLFFLMKSCDCSKKFKNLSLMTNGECDHVHFCNKTFVSLQNKFIILQDITTQHKVIFYIYTLDTCTIQARSRTLLQANTYFPHLLTVLQLSIALPDHILNMYYFELIFFLISSVYLRNVHIKFYLYGTEFRKRQQVFHHHCVLCHSTTKQGNILN